MATASDKIGVSFARRFLQLASGYWSSEHKWAVRLLTLALFILTVAQVTVPVLINVWSQQLFDALEQRSFDRFYLMIAAVGVIILFNVSVTVAHLRVKRRLQFGWRGWLSEKLLSDWLTRGRQHQVGYMPGDHDNPDGRIAEDIRIATEAFIELAVSLTYCVLLLASFTNILWHLSGSPEVIILGYTLHLHGHLLYAALVYAAMGTTIALLIGRPLVKAVNRRQGLEADFRFGLARVRENAQSIALLHGEPRERTRLFDLLGGVQRGWDGQTRALSNMMVFSAAYSVLSAAVPILVAAPRYISGSISLGVLMQTAQAFQQTVGALSWPIDNLARAAEWKASVERVLGLADALALLDHKTGIVAGEGGASRIQIDREDGHPGLVFQSVSIASNDGRKLLETFDLEIRPGQRMLITGDSAATLRLFRTVARVWPWGSGRVLLPADARIFFMPERPYIPHGTLRGALTYPQAADGVTDEQARAALARVGLAHLGNRLDRIESWERILTVPEQQLFDFARLLVARPGWIFIEEATDSLDPVTEAAMRGLLDEEFGEATWLTIGSDPALEASHDRKIVLDRDGGTVRLREEPIIGRAGVLSAGDDHVI